MGRIVKSSGEEEVLRLQASELDPRLHGLSGGRRDLELNRPLGFVLDDYGACGHLLAVTHVPNLEGDKVTATQLAVDAEVEESQFAARPSICSRTRSAQMSLSLNGA